MASVLNTYSINFKGLKLGKHSFEFDLNDKFFSEFKEGEIEHGQLKAKITLNKQNHLLELKINIKGFVSVVCDRCLELFDLPVNYKGELFVKIGTTEPSEETDDIIFISEEDYEINLAQYLYESVSLSLPLKRYHGINGTSISACDKEMLSRLNEAPEDNGSESEIDPRWEKLKNLKNN